MDITAFCNRVPSEAFFASDFDEVTKGVFASSAVTSGFLYLALLFFFSFPGKQDFFVCLFRAAPAAY